MNGNTLLSGGQVTPNAGLAWQAIGTGDFNQDSYSDILFQNKNTGQVSVWEMNGTSLIGGGPVSANPGLSWHAIGTGGGGSDILLQNTERPRLDLGHARKHDPRRRPCQPQPRAELASGRGADQLAEFTKFRHFLAQSRIRHYDVGYDELDRRSGEAPAAGTGGQGAECRQRPARALARAFRIQPEMEWNTRGIFFI